MESRSSSERRIACEATTMRALLEIQLRDRHGSKTGVCGERDALWRCVPRSRKPAVEPGGEP